MANHLSMRELEAAMEHLRQSPRDQGQIEMIVRRPAIDAREILAEGELHPAEGLVGDTWRIRSSSRTPDRSPHPDMQLTLMNSRVIALLAQDRARWPLAGDQLFLNMDLSPGNLPSGIRLAVGTAVIEVTAQPHHGCKKFVERFGLDALKFVSSAQGKRLRMRGIYARVVEPGTVQVGDVVTKMVGALPFSAETETSSHQFDAAHSHAHADAPISPRKL